MFAGCNTYKDNIPKYQVGRAGSHIKEKGSDDN